MQWKSGKERGSECMGQNSQFGREGEQATPKSSPTGDPNPGSRVLELVGQ